MPSRPKNILHEILDEAESYSLDDAIELYNELADKNDPDVIPVLMISMSDLSGDESDEEPSVRNRLGGKLQ